MKKTILTILFILTLTTPTHAGMFDWILGVPPNIIITGDINASDLNNTYVKKTGDTMTGPLKIETGASTVPFSVKNPSHDYNSVSVVFDGTGEGTLILQSDAAQIFEMRNGDGDLAFRMNGSPDTEGIVYVPWEFWDYFGVSVPGVKYLPSGSSDMWIVATNYDTMEFNSPVSTQFYINEVPTMAFDENGLDANGFNIFNVNDANVNRVSAANGSANSPSYSFFNDQKTGFYKISTGTMGFAANGAEELRVQADSIVFNNGTTDTELNFGINGLLTFDVGGISVAGAKSNIFQTFLGIQVHRESVIEEYSVAKDDYYIGVDVSGGTASIILPKATEEGRVLIVKDESFFGGTNDINVIAATNEFVGGISAAPNYLIAKNGGSVTLIADGNITWNAVNCFNC